MMRVATGYTDVTGRATFQAKVPILAYRKKKAVRTTIHSVQYARYNFLFRRRGAKSSMDSTAEPSPNTGRETCR